MTETPQADALLTALISGDPQIEGFAELVDEQEREKALNVLLAMLSDPNLTLRIRATQGLGRLGDRRAVEPLIRSLDTTDDNRLFGAKFGALAALGDSAAFLPLLTHYRSGSLGDVNYVLHAFDQEQVFQALSNAAKHPDKSVRYHVNRALTRLPGPRSVRLLIDALNDEWPGIRHNSIFGLVELGAVEAVPFLLSHTSDPDSNIRQSIAVALGRLSDPQAISALQVLFDDQNKEVRLCAAFALGKLGNAVAAGLIYAYIAGGYKQNFITTALEAARRLRLPVGPLLVTFAEEVLDFRLGIHGDLALIAEIFIEQGQPEALPVLEQMLKVTPNRMTLYEERANAENEAVRQLARQAIDAIKARMEDSDG